MKVLTFIVIFYILDWTSEESLTKHCLQLTKKFSAKVKIFQKVLQGKTTTYFGQGKVQ